MAARAYYNDNDERVVFWLRQLMRARVIADGYVDGRPIELVQPEDLRDFVQCHFFAGIGGWSYALRLAGWPDDRPVWTGSCPCQPFSKAGKGDGADDSRHVWPTWFRIIRELRPNPIFGEQVANFGGLAWFDAVSVDLETAGYAIGAADLCAASIGAPHIRQRLFFVADANRQGRAFVGASGLSRRDVPQGHDVDRRGAVGIVDDSRGARLEGRVDDVDDRNQSGRIDTFQVGSSAATGGVGDPWRNCEWIDCRDGTRRPIEPGTFPLVDGIPARVGRLRGYGNAIVPQVGALFIRAYLETALVTK